LLHTRVTKLREKIAGVTSVLDRFLLITSQPQEIAKKFNYGE